MRLMANEPDIDAMRAALHRHWLEDQAKRQRWGEQGPILNVKIDKWGRRVVAVWNRMLQLSANATYHDFLGLYLGLAFGEDWWQSESAKSAESAHQLVLWERKLRQFERQHMRGVGLQSAPIKGVIGHFYRLAFDLHTIEHQGLLQRSLIKRLKNPDQFQGARYEVAVSAAFVRGAFKVRLEAEGKGPDKLCEFVATHNTSGASYAVEAKSRHLPGILGRPAQPARAQTVEPNVTGLITKALQKKAEHTRVICVDVNVPQAEGSSPPTTWGPVVRTQVKALENAGHGPAILIFTNSPSHYLGDGDVVRGDAAMIMGLSEPRFQPQDIKSVQEFFPGLIRVGNAFSMPVPANWE